MEFINEWTYSICITLVVSIIFSLLLPQGTFAKFSKMIMAVFISLSFILPLKNADFSDIIPELDIEIEKQNEDTYENIIEANIKNTLIDGGYSGCITDCSVSESDKEICIESAEIFAPQEFDCNEIKDYVFDKIGIYAEVYHIGE